MARGQESRSSPFRTRDSLSLTARTRELQELVRGGFIVVVADDPLADVRILQDKDKIAQLLTGGQTIVRRAT